MRIQTIILILIVSISLNGQVIADLENIPLDMDSFDNGNDGSGGFESGNIFLPNLYDATFDAWSGWSISSKIDADTPGFGNQYSARPGSGFDGSDNYAVGFAFDKLIINLTGDAIGKIVEGLYFTNSAYAYWSMKDGDAFAKKFGGADGNDKDFFFVTIKKYNQGELSQDSIDVYLADFRFNNNNNDYILDTWRYIDLRSLGSIDSLELSFTSSDTGAFGINTPTYICIDNLETTTTSSVDNVQENLHLDIYPNPSSSIINLNGTEKGSNYKIVDLSGREMFGGVISEKGIDISHLRDGIYAIIVSLEDKNIVSRFTKG